MGFRIGASNPLAAQSSILLQQAQLQKNLAQLASGLRINTAADDPAGFVISEQLRANISGLNAAVTNTSRATNLVQTAEGALAEINTQLAGIRGLAVQAGSGALLGETGLRAIQEQIAGATAGIDRIGTTTEFAGRPLLNGAFEDEQFAISEGDPATLTIPNLATTELGRGVGNLSGFENLAQIDVTTPQGATDALRVIDAAIDDVSRVRGELGAFQTNVLETASRSLKVTRENLLFSESGIRDTDFTQATGESVLAQIRLQASILAQDVTNRNSGMLLDLLG